MTMATIVLAYDPDMYWDQFLKLHNIRHDTYVNDPKKFILYYYDEFHLLKLGFEFGMFYNKKIYQDVQQFERND